MVPEDGCQKAFKRKQFVEGTFLLDISARRFHNCLSSLNMLQNSLSEKWRDVVEDENYEKMDGLLDAIKMLVAQDLKTRHREIHRKDTAIRSQ